MYFYFTWLYGFVKNYMYVKKRLGRANNISLWSFLQESKLRGSQVVRARAENTNFGVYLLSRSCRKTWLLHWLPFKHFLLHIFPRQGTSQPLKRYQHVVTTNFHSRNLIILICHHRFVIALVYYAVAFSTGTFGGNRYLVFFLASLVEIPSNYTAIVLCKK